MTVEELVRMLNKLPNNAEVFIIDYGCGQRNPSEIVYKVNTNIVEIK